MPECSPLINLSDLQSAGDEDRDALASVESQLQDYMNHALHSVAKSGANEEYVRTALPLLLLSIAARQYLANHGGTSSPRFTGDFLRLADQSIRWANDRLVFSPRMLN